MAAELDNETCRFLARAARHAGDNMVNRALERAAPIPKTINLKLQYKFQTFGSTVDVRTTDGDTENIVAHAHFGLPRPRIPALGTRLKRNGGFSLRKCISEYNLRQVTREVIPPEIKVMGFLRGKRYWSQVPEMESNEVLWKRLTPSLTGKEIYNMIKFIYKQIDPRFLLHVNDKAEIIKSIVEVSKKCYPTVTIAIKKDYLLNPMAPHAKKCVFKFMAELCDFVSQRLEA